MGNIFGAKFSSSRLKFISLLYTKKTKTNTYSTTRLFSLSLLGQRKEGDSLSKAKPNSSLSLSCRLGDSLSKAKTRFLSHSLANSPIHLSLSLHTLSIRSLLQEILYRSVIIGHDNGMLNFILIIFHKSLVCLPLQPCVSLLPIPLSLSLSLSLSLANKPDSLS